MSEEKKMFIVWDPRDGNPTRDDTGNINTAGVMGRVEENNVYLTTYAKFPDERRPADLEVGYCIRGVEYGLSGSKGTYDIYRVDLDESGLC